MARKQAGEACLLHKLRQIAKIRLELTLVDREAV
jgi:hypothetical protein